VWKGHHGLKHSKGLLPKKFNMKYIKPLARAWATFLVSTLESHGNASEFCLVRVVAVQAIMKGDDIDLG